MFSHKIENYAILYITINKTEDAGMSNIYHMTEEEYNELMELDQWNTETFEELDSMEEK